MIAHIHYFQLLLIVLIFIRYNANVYAREEGVGYRSTCAAQVDCGYGIWNDNTCECNCIPPYCFDELYQSCVAQGSCPNAFEGCTPFVNCPYYYNPAGRCDSGSTIYPGVFAIFWDADSCCNANFPSDVSTCLDAAATSQIMTSEPTPEPTPAPSPAAPVADSPVAISPVATLEISIPLIPMSLINLPAQLELDKDQIRRVEYIIMNSTTNEISSELDVLLLSMKVSKSTNEEDWDKTLSLEIRPVVIVTSDMTYSVQDMRASILKIMNNQNGNIASQLIELLGQGSSSDSVALYFGDKPVSTPSIHTRDDGKDNIKLTVVLASVFTILFVVACCGHMIWRRGHQKNEVPTKRIVAAEDDKSIGSSIRKHQSRAHETDDGYDGGNSSYMNSFDESNFSFPTTDDSSKEGGNSVLGLLYYDGPNSSQSDEDDLHQSRAASRASRRSRRSNRSGKSTQSSTRSHKPRASATNKSSRSNRQNRQKPLEKLDEDNEVRNSKKEDPEGLDGSTISFSIAGDSFYDTYPPMRQAGGVESVASDADAPNMVTTHSKKRTPAGSRAIYPPDDDFYNKQNRSRLRGEMSMSAKTDAFSVSVNSTGEHTSDLRNQPDVKF